MEIVNQINRKITYNNYVVISAKIVDKIVFVKTYDKYTTEVIWFIGYNIGNDLVSNIRRILTEEKCYKNEYFKSMFQENTIVPKIKVNKE